MALPLSVSPSGVTAAGSPASAKVTANARVSTASGPVGVIADVMQFPGPAVIGNWVMGCTRVSIMGMPAINQASTGTSFTPVLAPAGPMIVTQGDARASGL
jgi:hypothetical protein